MLSRKAVCRWSRAYRASIDHVFSVTTPSPTPLSNRTAGDDGLTTETARLGYARVEPPGLFRQDVYHCGLVVVVVVVAVAFEKLLIGVSGGVVGQVSE